ncbi:hypothetical protein QBC43DRAFT_338644 [Cladorrhinum sp. PSN259]|nr:hypothetical protein QBC43DRAFT_338644 [Cladorrhinum sp. PSN259]
MASEKKGEEVNKNSLNTPRAGLEEIAPGTSRDPCPLAARDAATPPERHPASGSRRLVPESRSRLNSARPAGPPEDSRPENRVQSRFDPQAFRPHCTHTRGRIQIPPPHPPPPSPPPFLLPLPSSQAHMILGYPPHRHPALPGPGAQPNFRPLTVFQRFSDSQAVRPPPWPLPCPHRPSIQYPPPPLRPMLPGPIQYPPYPPYPEPLAFSHRPALYPTLGTAYSGLPPPPPRSTQNSSNGPHQVIPPPQQSRPNQGPSRRDIPSARRQRTTDEALEARHIQRLEEREHERRLQLHGADRWAPLIVDGTIPLHARRGGAAGPATPGPEARQLQASTGNSNSRTPAQAERGRAVFSPGTWCWTTAAAASPATTASSGSRWSQEGDLSTASTPSGPEVSDK